ncbi:MAG: hypothetical protein K8963_09615 [Proteobacteria bacterium]|nr:hypothetical protein [Pseudomonadota bacterium]
MSSKNKNRPPAPTHAQPAPANETELSLNASESANETAPSAQVTESTLSGRAANADQARCQRHRQHGAYFANERERIMSPYDANYCLDCAVQSAAYAIGSPTSVSKNPTPTNSLERT